MNQARQVLFHHPWDLTLHHNTDDLSTSWIIFQHGGTYLNILESPPFDIQTLPG